MDERDIAIPAHDERYLSSSRNYFPSAKPQTVPVDGRPRMMLHALIAEQIPIVVAYHFFYDIMRYK